MWFVVYTGFNGVNCKAYGDVHYYTFDRKKIHFQGICKYTLVKPCPPKEKKGVPEFNVEVSYLCLPSSMCIGKEVAE